MQPSVCKSQARHLMYKFSWNTRSFGANDLNHWLPILNRPLSCQREPTKWKLPYRNTGIDFMEVGVRTYEVRAPILPFVRPRKSGPKEFFTRFHLTYPSAKVPVGKVSQVEPAFRLTSYFHTTRDSTKD